MNTLFIGITSWKYRNIRFTIESYIKHTKIPYKIVVWDNGAFDHGPAAHEIDAINNELKGTENFNYITTIPSINIGCCSSRTELWKYAKILGLAGDYFILSDEDVMPINDNWIQPAVDIMNSKPLAGIVSWRDLAFLDINPYDEEGEVWDMPGTCCLFKTSVVDKINGWDMDIFMHLQDTLFNRMMQTGCINGIPDHNHWEGARIYLVQEAKLIAHPEPGSAGRIMGKVRDIIVQHDKSVAVGKFDFYGIKDSPEGGNRMPPFEKYD